MKIILHIDQGIALINIGATTRTFGINSVGINETMSVRGAWTRFLAVGDHIDACSLAGTIAFASIGTVAAPVIDYIVAKIHHTPIRHSIVVLINVRAVDAWIPAVVMGKQVVVETCIAAAPYATITVITLAMMATLHTLCKDAPLHRETLVGIERSALINAPAH